MTFKSLIGKAYPASKPQSAQQTVVIALGASRPMTAPERDALNAAARSPERLKRYAKINELPMK